MADNNEFRRYAGDVAFPRRMADLTSTTQCPACRSPLTSAVCDVCDLDLGNPLAAELAALSADTATLLGHRINLIGRIRFDTAAQAAAASASIPDAAAIRDAVAAATSVPDLLAPPLATPPLAASVVSLTPPPIQPIPTPTPVAAEPSAPRRSSIQIALLVIGISLLSVAAIFFLVYAFINFGILGRSIIIGAVTVATLVVASLLRRRSLTATAEGIAVLGVVLVYLDAFAVRANDFGGSARSDAAIYWGAALVVCAVLFALWHRASGLRTPNVIAFGTLAPGVALLVGGLVRTTDAAADAYWALLALAVAGVVHAAASRVGHRVERTLALVSVVVGLIGAFVGAVFMVPDADWAPLAALLLVAVVAAGHVALLIGRDDTVSTGFRRIIAGYSGVAAASAVGIAVVRQGDPALGSILPALAAAVVALGLELLARRSAGQPVARPAVVASVSAAIVAGIAVAFPALVALVAAGTVVSHAVSTPWNHAPDAVLVRVVDLEVFSVLGLTAVGAVIVAFWALGGTLRRRAAVVSGLAAGLLVLAAPLVGVLWGVLAVLVVLAAAGVIVLRRFAGAPAVRIPAIALVAVSTAFAYSTSWASAGTWLAVSLATIVILLAARPTVGAAWGRAALLGVASVVALVAGGAGGRQLALGTTTRSAVELIDGLRGVQLVAILLLAASALAPAAIRTADRRAVFGVTTVTLAVSTAIAVTAVPALPASDRMSLLLPEPLTSVLIAAALLVALGLWLLARATATARIERIVASIALAPVLASLVDAVARALGFDGSAIAPMAAVVIAGGGALAIALTRPGHARSPRELGVALVGIPTVLVSLVLPSESTWLVLLLAGVAALLLAISRDGLFSSASPRRLLGWLALALSTGGLWWRLAGDRVDSLEPFVLPLAGVLLLIALFVWRADRASRGAPLIALAGLLVAILPLGVDSIDGPVIRALIVGGVSGVLALGGSLVLGSARLRPYLDVSALAGTVGVLVVALGRATAIAIDGRVDLSLDGWLAAALLVLGIAAFGQMRRRADDSVAWRARAGQTLAILAIAAVTVLEIPGFADPRFGFIRAISVLFLLSALHVIAVALDRAPLSRPFGWVTIALAGVTGIAALATGALDQVEWVSVPIAAALIVTGALELTGTPTSRSWPWLAPGVAVLLLPSLIATIGHPPVWRLVALGVVAILVLIASVRLRLQAPFVLSAVVLVIHVIATFAPQIRSVYESVEWWLWLVPGGIIVVVFAARFEKSMAGFRGAATRVRALR